MRIFNKMQRSISHGEIAVWRTISEKNVKSIVSYRDNIRKNVKKTVGNKHKSEKKHNSPITARIHTRHWQSQCRAEKSHPTITKTSQGRNPRPKPEETHKTNYPRPKPLIRGLKIHTKKKYKNI